MDKHNDFISIIGIIIIFFPLGYYLSYTYAGLSVLAIAIYSVACQIRDIEIDYILDNEIKEDNINGNYGTNTDTRKL
jgi:hypothetical protein